MADPRLVRVLRADRILPVAEAMMSTRPKNAHTGARRNKSMMLNTIVRPAGDGGVSTISSAARQEREREVVPVEAFTDS
jgi:hypothetical protein